MNTFFKHTRSLFFVAVFGSCATLAFISCQKANPDPYSNPPLSTLSGGNPTTPPDTTPTFSASVNSSAVITFTPVKRISGSYIYLSGVSTYYTIYLIIPNSTGPGTYSVGFGGGISFRIVNGSTVYRVNNAGGSGTLSIDSISNNKYYGTFSCIGVDSANISDGIIVNQGSFTHL